MSENKQAGTSGLNRAKPYQLVLFPLNNGATNVYYVLVLSYIATFGSKDVYKRQQQYLDCKGL